MTETPSGTPELELERALKFLQAARYLLAGGFSEDAVSRAYYAVFHAASALIGLTGRTVRTHDGLRAAFALHFVKSGTFDPKFNRLLSRIAADRNDADYGAVTTFRLEDAELCIQQAAEFLDAVAAHLRSIAASHG